MNEDGADVDMSAGTQGQLEFEDVTARQLRHKDATSFREARQAKFIRLQVLPCPCLPVLCAATLLLPCPMSSAHLPLSLYSSILSVLRALISPAAHGKFIEGFRASSCQPSWTPSQSIITVCVTICPHHGVYPASRIALGLFSYCPASRAGAELGGVPSPLAGDAAGPRAAAS